MICAIVLAAGESRRMDARARCQKLLLPFGGKTIITCVINTLLNSAVDQVFAVTGRDADMIVKELADSAATIVNNPDYQSGMLSSVRCGLRALPHDCQAVMVVLGDQPTITRKLVDDLIQAFTTNRKGIVVPVFHGKRGHPILFSAGYRDEILTRYDDVGLRGLLYAHPDDVFELTFSDPCVLSDIDYPEDYQRELTALDDHGPARPGDSADP